MEVKNNWPFKKKGGENEKEDVTKLILKLRIFKIINLFRSIDMSEEFINSLEKDKKLNSKKVSDLMMDNKFFENYGLNANNTQKNSIYKILLVRLSEIVKILHIQFTNRFGSKLFYLHFCNL